MHLLCTCVAGTRISELKTFSANNSVHYDFEISFPNGLVLRVELKAGHFRPGGRVQFDSGLESFRSYLYYGDLLFFLYRQRGSIGAWTIIAVPLYAEMLGFVAPISYHVL